MRKLKTLVAGAAAVGAMSAGIWAASVTTASADVACNRWHECWHVQDRYDYPGNLGVTFHADTWHNHRYHWRDNHDGRGYYRNGVWITF